MSKQVERRFFAHTDFRVSSVNEPRKINGYGAVFDSPSENLGWSTELREEIDPHAFDSVLASSPDVRGLFNHDSNFVLGRTTAGTMRLSVDARGLAYEIDPPDTQFARDLMVSMRRGDITGSSFAFVVKRDQWTDNPDGSISRRILEFDELLDVSPVTYPAYPATNAQARSLPASTPAAIRAKLEKRSNADGCDCPCHDCTADDCDSCSNPVCDGLNCRCNQRAARAAADAEATKETRSRCGCNPPSRLTPPRFAVRASGSLRCVRSHTPARCNEAAARRAGRPAIHSRRTRNTMPTIRQLQEKRTKLVHDAAAIMQAENVTAEQRAQVNTMLADEQVIVADIRAMEALEASDKELRSTERPHRGSPTGGQSEEEVRNTETRSAFEKFVRFGLGSMSNEERGLLRERRDITTTGASGNVAGNVIIPQLFDNVLNDAKKLAGNTVSVVRHKVTNNNGAPIKIGTANDTGNTLTTLTLEATAVTEQDPALGGFIGQTDTVTTLVKVSLQDLEDSAFDLDAWIKAKFGLRYYRGLEYMITAGNTSNVASMVTGATLGGTTLANTGPVYDDFRACYGALEPAYIPNGKWVMNQQTRVWVMGLKDTLGRPIFIPNPNTGTLDYILGLPIVLNQALPAATTAAATGILLGDFEEGYILRTDGPLSIRRLEERYIDTLEIGFLAYARVGGYNVDAGTHPILKLTTHA